MQRSSADGRGDLCRLVNPTRTPALWAPPQSGQLKPAKRVAAEYVGNRPMKMQKAPTVKQRASTEGVHLPTTDWMTRQLTTRQARRCGMHTHPVSVRQAWAQAGLHL
jgi:hypothetical protein